MDEGSNGMSDDRVEIIKKRAAEVNAMWERVYPNGREVGRIDTMIEMLRQTWHKYPEQRLAQLVANIVALTDAYYMEDDEMARRIATYGDVGP